VLLWRTGVSAIRGREGLKRLVFDAAAGRA
jgi:hypothetical protein